MIGTQFATRSEVEALRRKLQQVISGAGVVQHGSDTDMAENFIDLADVPQSYAGAGGYVVKVNSGATDLEFVEDRSWKHRQSYRVYSWDGTFAQDPVPIGLNVSGTSPAEEWSGSPSDSFYCISTGSLAGEFLYFYNIGPVAQMDGDMAFYAKFKTGNSIASIRIHIGIFGAPNSISNSDNVPSHSYSFRFSDAVSANWYAMTNDGVTQVPIDTGISVAVSTVYDLRIIISGSGTKVEFYINGTLVHTATTNLSAATSLLGWGLKMFTTAAGAKRGGFSVMGWERGNTVL